ncbi:hypothetical protein BS47DRAFT_1367535 [Hydnum rufescens UP504]|uniref:Uncharacterized protein n=1 Tax=Hydnum rufescens UP504 TaxID=1448309 RepID=A0A9P6AI05_9AGAM|nr:hypothetical protein BS47DRAFT_1367535 [Hydnum rufescens UP504]
MQSRSSALLSAPSHSLNIWQYSIQNRTWARHQPATNPPQGAVGESVACIAVGRDNSTCIWLLNLASWMWSELPGFFPRGARVYGMSAVGSVVYFMGSDLAEDLPSPVVHCDLSTFEPFVESSRGESKAGVKSLIFPPSMSVQITEPSTPLGTEGPSFFPPTSQSPPRHTEVAASVLPSYDTAPSPLNPRVATILFLTPYRKLHECHGDSQFEKLKNNLTSEWTTCAMIAMCFIGVNGAIFGFTKDSTIVTIDDIAERAVAVSMLSSVLSLAAAAWMYCVYYPQDGDTFRHQARDALNTYAIFSIRARVPFACDCVAIAAFIVFVLHSLIEVYPRDGGAARSCDRDPGGSQLDGILLLFRATCCRVYTTWPWADIPWDGSDTGDTASVMTVVGTEESGQKHDGVTSVPS